MPVMRLYPSAEADKYHAAQSTRILYYEKPGPGFGTALVCADLGNPGTGKRSMRVLFQMLMITFTAGVLGTGMGGILGTVFCRDSVKITGLMAGFAAGIMLSVVCFSMIGEAVVPENASRPMSILLVNSGIAAGFFVVWQLNSWIETVGERGGMSIGASGRSGDIKNVHLLTAGMVMILAIAVHNIPEGMVIGASGAADASGGAGMLMALVIGIHNVPEGMAVAVALAGGGMGKVRTVLLTAVSGFPTVIGTAIGWKLGAMGPVMLCLMLSLAAGAMLYVVMGELIPEALEMWHSKMIAVSILLGMLTGLLIIFA